MTAVMDQFGDAISDATEAGLIATATPAEWRAASDTAGTSAVATKIRTLDSGFRELPVGEVGFSCGAKDFHDGYMASGDVGSTPRSVVRGRPQPRDDRVR